MVPSHTLDVTVSSDKRNDITFNTHRNIYSLIVIRTNEPTSRLETFVHKSDVGIIPSPFHNCLGPYPLYKRLKRRTKESSNTRSKGVD